MNDKIEIRESNVEDLAGISLLYNNSKTNDELFWLLFNQKGPQKKSFVALSEKGEIIGHIAGIKSVYGKEEFQSEAIFPILWIVKKEYQKTIGLKLFSVLMRESKHALAIGGSSQTQQILPLFRFSKIIDTQIFTKILLPWKFRNSKMSDISLKKNNIPPQALSSYKIFTNKIDTEYLEWLKQCPMVKTELLALYHGGQCIGRVLIYYKTRFLIFKTAQITHLDYLGTEEGIWLKSLKAISGHLRMKKVSAAFILSSSPKLHQYLKQLNFITHKRLTKPLYIKSALISEEGIKADNISLTFIEGDLSYRHL